MNRKRVLGLMLVCLFAARETFADTLVLRDGTRLKGAIANQEQLKSHPELQETISIVTDDTRELRRFAAGEVAYMVFEGPNGVQVIDPTTVRVPAPLTPADGTRTFYRKTGRALNCVLGGIAVGTVGALVKFGRTTGYATEDEYNGVNYAMMAAGGALIGVGLFLLGDTAPEASAVESGPNVSLAVDRGSMEVGAGWRLAF